MKTARKALETARSVLSQGQTLYALIDSSKPPAPPEADTAAEDEDCEDWEWAKTHHLAKLKDCLDGLDAALKDQDIVQTLTLYTDKDIKNEYADDEDTVTELEGFPDAIQEPLDAVSNQYQKIMDMQKRNRE